MTTVLRILRHTDIVSDRPALKAYQARARRARLPEGDGGSSQAVRGEGRLN